MRGLKDTEQVESLQDQAQIMLASQIRLKQAAHPIRFGRLLLMLPLLRLVPAERVASLYFRRVIGSTSMEKVLGDMFKGQP